MNFFTMTIFLLTWMKTIGAPTSVPTVEPSLEPTPVPTVEPSLEPTAVPTVEPSLEPTSTPTSTPTFRITGIPTNIPTSMPSANPTQINTPRMFDCTDETDTLCDSADNACTFVASRYIIDCAGVDVCTVSAKGISFIPAAPGTTQNVTLLGACELSFEASSGNVTFENNTYIEAKDGSLKATAKSARMGGLNGGYVKVSEGSSLVSRMVTLVAEKTLDVFGSVDVSGTSTEPNAAYGNSQGDGWGGSYGGSGGRTCRGDDISTDADEIPYSNVETAVGSADIFSDYNTGGLTAIQGKAGMDAGHGEAGGRGGGVVILQGDEVTIVGTVDARGDPSIFDNAGSGSGGAIGIVANKLIGSGTLTVRGGESISDSGGAGGGGRMTFRTTYNADAGQLGPFYSDSGALNYLNLAQSLHIDLGGGNGAGSVHAVGCACSGGSGTFYTVVMADGVEVTDVATTSADEASVVAGHLLLNNDNSCARAVSVTSVDAGDTLPKVSSVTILAGALLTVPRDQPLLLRSGLNNNYTSYANDALSTPCLPNQVLSFACSYLYISDTSVASDVSTSLTGLAFNALERAHLFMSADYVTVVGRGSIHAPMTPRANLTVSAAALHTANGTLVCFRSSLVIEVAFEAELNGVIRQVNSSDNYLPNSGFTVALVGASLNGTHAFTLSQNTNLTISGEVRVYTSITVFASYVTLHGTAYVGIPDLVPACWPLTNTFMCPGINKTGIPDSVTDINGATSATLYPPPTHIATQLNNGTVYVAGSEGIIMDAQATIVSPATLMCSEGLVSISSQSHVQADGLGCSANNGVSPGSTDVYTLSGGSGGGYGGAGGTVMTETGLIDGGFGQTDYPEAVTPFSSGSGGGCSHSLDCGGSYEVSGPSSRYNVPYMNGGGIIVVYAKRILTLWGTLSANGGAGKVMHSSRDDRVGGGGGSGGIIISISGALVGRGNYSANGGLGGGIYSPGDTASRVPVDYYGAGGGGGQVWLYSMNSWRNSIAETNGKFFNYSGYVDVQGGAAGQGDNRSIHEPATWRHDSSGVESTTFASKAGVWGVVLWPACSGGYGNDFKESSAGLYDIAEICSLCPTGFYSTGGHMSGSLGANSFQTNCSACDPLINSDHADYIDNELFPSSSPECECQCDNTEFTIIVYKDTFETAPTCLSGETQCISNLDYVINSYFGGMAGFVTVCCLVSSLIIAAWLRKPLFKLIKERNKKETFVRKFGTNVQGDEVYLRHLEGHKGDKGDVVSTTVENPLSASKPEYQYENNEEVVVGGVDSWQIDSDEDDFDIINPVHEGDRSSHTLRTTMEMVELRKSKDTTDGSQISRERDPGFRSKQDRDRNVRFHVNTADNIVRHRTRILLLRGKLGESDMPYHCHRVYLYGNNHPLSGRGGPWKMDGMRPTSLRPMLDAHEYHNFASQINDSLRWPVLGWEMLLFIFVSVFFPPFAPYVLYRLRKMRGQKLLDYINSYDHMCFRHPLQRKHKSSIRVGISPCFTLASVDFLYEYEDAPTTDGEGDYAATNALCRPLTPIGQSKLPTVFRFAGIGTYFTPFSVDTNDMLIQTISQTDVPTKFIQRPWIDFVAELNNRLRMIQPSGLCFGLRRVIMFLDKINSSDELGGIVVEVVTLANAVPAETEANKARREASKRLNRMSHDVESGKMEASMASSGPSERASRASAVGVDTRRTTLGSISETTLPPENAETTFKESEDRIPGESDSPTHEFRSKPPRASLRQSWFGSYSGQRDSENVPPLWHLPALSDNATPRDDPAFDGEEQDGKETGGNVSFLHFLQGSYSALEDRLQRVPPFEHGGSLGTLLNFDETCAQIASGRLSLGLRVTAPKVAKQARVLCDEDYLSDDEEQDYLEDLQAMHRKRRGVERASQTRSSSRATAVGSELASRSVSREKSSSPSPLSVDTMAASGTDVGQKSPGYGGISATTRLAFDEEDQSMETRERDKTEGASAAIERRQMPGQRVAPELDREAAECVSVSLKKAYGGKGAEKEKDMLRFYRIMLDAEKETQSQLSSSTREARPSIATGEVADGDGDADGDATTATSSGASHTNSVSRNRRKSEYLESSIGSLLKGEDIYKNLSSEREKAVATGASRLVSFDEEEENSFEISGNVKSFKRGNVGARVVNENRDEDGGGSPPVSISTRVTKSSHAESLASLFGQRHSESSTDGKDSEANSRYDAREGKTRDQPQHGQGDTPWGESSASVSRGKDSQHFSRANDSFYTKKLTRRDRSAIAFDTLAPSNHQILINAWCMRDFIVEASSSFASVSPLGVEKVAEEGGFGRREIEKVQHDRGKDPSSSIRGAGNAATKSSGDGDLIAISSGPGKSVLKGSVREIVSEHMVRTQCYYFLRHRKDLEYFVKGATNSITEYPLAANCENAAADSLSVNDKQPIFATSAYDDLGRLIHDTRNSHSTEREGNATFREGSAVGDIKKLGSRTASGDGQSSLGTLGTVDTTNGSFIANTTTNSSESVNAFSKPGPEDTRRHFGSQDLSRSRISFLDRFSQVTIPEHSADNDFMAGSSPGRVGTTVASTSNESRETTPTAKGEASGGMSSVFGELDHVVRATPPKTEPLHEKSRKASAQESGQDLHGSYLSSTPPGAGVSADEAATTFASEGARKKDERTTASSIDSFQSANSDIIGEPPVKTAYSAYTRGVWSASITCLIETFTKLRLFFAKSRHSQGVYLLLRLFFGANISPLGRQYGFYARRGMNVLLFVLCCGDLCLFTLVAIIGRLYLCPHTETYHGVQQQCLDSQSNPYILLLIFVWPGAVLFSSIGGITILTSRLRAHFLRIYVSWSRMCFIPVLNFVVLFYSFNTKRLGVFFEKAVDSNDEGQGNAAQLRLLVNVSIILTLSRVIQIAIAEQFIAHVERMRWTLGWDGLMTALFVTKDVRTEVVTDNNIFRNF